MDEVTLVSESFEKNGSGVSSNGLEFLTALKRYSTYKITAISTDIYLRKVKLTRRTLNKKIYFLLNKNTIKGKFVHAISPEAIPIKYLKLPKRKIVSLHDLYLFEPNYIKYLKEGNSYIKSVLNSRFLRYRQNYYKNIEKYDAILSVSDLTKEKAVKLLGLPPEKIDVVNINIINEKFKPYKIEKRNGAFIIGYINNYTWNKTEKLKTFIEKFKAVKDGALKLNLYGKGFPYQNLIKDDKRIKYFGFLDENKIVETYNSFDAYLSTSTVEGFGLPIMQAKACNVPVLCYDGEIPDLVKRNTLLWDDNNIEQVLRDKSWGKVDVERGHKDAEECRPDKVIHNVIKIYNKVFV